MGLFEKNGFDRGGMKEDVVEAREERIVREEVSLDEDSDGLTKSSGALEQLAAQQTGPGLSNRNYKSC